MGHTLGDLIANYNCDKEKKKIFKCILQSRRNQQSNECGK